jgi:AcrR family transcriptional regulator
VSSDRNVEPSGLPRGRHNLPREAVLESQRTRLVRAMLDCVADKGYPATTVSDVVSTARVSRNAFYELFADKEACYLAACDEAGADMLQALYRYGAEQSWLDALRGGLHAYLEWWRANPLYAVAYIVEIPAAGRRAVEQRDRVYAQFAAMFDALGQRAREEQPELPALSPVAARALVSAITDLVGAEVRKGRVDRLGDLEDDLLELVVRVLADDATAAHVAERVARAA